MLKTTSPNTGPPRCCSKRRRMNARWISSLSPPATTATKPNRMAAAGEVSRVSKGFSDTVCSQGANFVMMLNAMVTRSSATGTSARPSRPSDTFERSPTRMAMGCSPRATSKSQTSAMMSPASITERVTMYASESCPAASTGVAPARLRSTTIPSCVGNPEQSTTSPTALRRSPTAAGPVVLRVSIG